LRKIWYVIATIVILAIISGVAYALIRDTSTTASPLPPSSSPSASQPYLPPAPTKTAGCHVVGALPDANCTPGAVIATAMTDQICKPGYSGGVRNVSDSEKRAVYAEYGIYTHQTGQYEVDHLISLELGGSNDIANLWPEAANPKPGFHQKDGLENTLHAKVCAGTITLAEAQREIATNWLQAYQTG
jgi:hypothetical protein